MKYEIVYFDEGGAPVNSETLYFAIYQVKDDMSEMRCYYTVGSNIIKYNNDEPWFKYIRLPDGYQRFLSEEELFALCL